MASFSYIAFDPKGRETRGTLRVADQSEAIGRLREMGWFPTKLEEVDDAVAALTSLLEPLLIVFLAVIVGAIVVALFLPLVTIIDQI